jgi:hypothetical protein
MKWTKYASIHGDEKFKVHGLTLLVCVFPEDDPKERSKHVALET